MKEKETVTITTIIQDHKRKSNVGCVRPRTEKSSAVSYLQELCPSLKYYETIIIKLTEKVRGTGKARENVRATSLSLSLLLAKNNAHIFLHNF